MKRTNRTGRRAKRNLFTSDESSINTIGCVSVIGASKSFFMPDFICVNYHQFLGSTGPASL